MKFLTLNDPKEIRIERVEVGECDFCGETKPCIRSPRGTVMDVCEDCINQLSELIK